MEKARSFTLAFFRKSCRISHMSSGAIAQLMGFITVPDFTPGKQNSSLLKFRLAFNRFDFSKKQPSTEFLTVTAFGKMAERIHSDIQNNMNYICCFCDVRVSKYNSKSGIPVEHTEFIINDCRMFFKPKAKIEKIGNDQQADQKNDTIEAENSIPGKHYEHANHNNSLGLGIHQNSFFHY